MSRKRKGWQEKLADARAKPGLPRKWFCDKAEQTMVVPHPDEIEAIVRKVRKGRLITIAQIGERIRDQHKADMACPMTTGIFMWLIAHANDELEEAGRKRVVPWWRVLKTGGELNVKYPEGGAKQEAKLKAEGHRVTTKGRGKKRVVAGYEEVLVGEGGKAEGTEGPRN